MTSRGEEGYALVAAVASIAVFAAMALALVSAGHLHVADAAAEQDQMQASAAADAGIVLALSHLLAGGMTQRWSIDGRERRILFGTAQLRIHIEDERGKIPVSRLNEKLAMRLLEEIGLSGDRLMVARDSLLDWTDSDNDPRPFGAEAVYYAPLGIVPSNGFLSSVEELRSIRGFDADMVERLRPMITSYTALGSFDPRYANPRALAIMEDAGDKNGLISIDRERELAGQQTALAFSDAEEITGRPLTIMVEAVLPDGGRSVRRAVVELTGAANRPYIVRAAE